MRYSIPAMRGLILLAAILLWANIHAFAFQTREVQVPLSIQNLDENLAIANPLAPITVKVSGRGYHLNRINETNLVLGMDLRSARAGESITQEVRLLSVPPQVNILGWDPKELQLEIETATTKVVPVTILTEGSVGDGRTITQLTANPPEVTVRGAPSLLANISEVTTRVKLQRNRNSFTVPSIPTVTIGEGVTPVNLGISPTRVSVTVTIAEGSSTRTLGIKPTLKGVLPAGFYLKEIRFSPPLVTIQGNARQLATLEYLSSSPINLEDQRQTYRETVSIDLPRGLTAVGESLVEAEVVIELSGSSREFFVTPQFINITEGFGVTAADPKTIRVVVSGDSTALGNLSRNDIALNIDLQGILSGSNQIPITAGMFGVPEGVSVGSFTPDTIEVILSRL